MKIATTFASLAAVAAAVRFNKRGGSSTAATSGTIGMTASDIQNGVCAPTTLIFARGTTEPGNMGTVVGPPLANQLISGLGQSQVAVQGVNYPADIAGAASGSTNPKGAQGAQMMAQFTTMALQACPSTKVVLAGYSQGAEQVHGALMNLNAGQVSAAVTFGDPLRNQSFQNINAAQTLINCAPGDDVCDDEFVISAAHLSYGTNGDVQKSATFIQQQLAN